PRVGYTLPIANGNNCAYSQSLGLCGTPMLRSRASAVGARPSAEPAIVSRQNRIGQRAVGRRAAHLAPGRRGPVRTQRGTLRLLAERGKLRARKIARNWVTTAEAVTEYLTDEEKRSKDPYKNKRH